MRSNPALRAKPHRGRIHPALRSFADECRETVVRLLAYVGALALIGLIVFYAANPLTDAAITAAAEPAARAGWSGAMRSHPAFAVSQIDLPGATASTEILRHPDGGRKDILRWALPGQPPVAEITLYRPGNEARAEVQGLPDIVADIAARLDPGGGGAAQPAGLIDSKFGTVALFDLGGRANRCFGFFKRIDEASLRISGWTCRGDSLPQRRAAAGCMLDRLVLLSAGGDTALAETFARAELRRQGCKDGQSQQDAGADWVLGAQNPRLRGTF
ncbi:hypothetical protein [Rhodopseudomonas pseudopalustris]|uniref:Uncharacterized protein n=1 Tax=Rhodopseudomonas pseudopalustris TaxID=1513892 RepID=A0A1H8X7F2_9BRAD|nr:hypothetical protein [Rhodopseudomonas pseudopalustris]SEP35627.1 hypothetical protein SAMN05444123_1174 [Rhodopseudomonas pseudopalustris]